MSRKSPLDEEELLQLFSQICLALHYVHSHNVNYFFLSSLILTTIQILHRDIKTSNILVSNYGNQRILKLGDFGISKLMSSKSKAETVRSFTFKNWQLLNIRLWELHRIFHQNFVKEIRILSQPLLKTDQLDTTLNQISGLLGAFCMKWLVSRDFSKPL